MATFSRISAISILILFLCTFKTISSDVSNTPVASNVSSGVTNTTQFNVDSVKAEGSQKNTTIFTEGGAFVIPSIDPPELPVQVPANRRRLLKEENAPESKPTTAILPPAQSQNNSTNAEKKTITSVKPTIRPILEDPTSILSQNTTNAPINANNSTTNNTSTKSQNASTTFTTTTTAASTTEKTTTTTTTLQTTTTRKATPPTTLKPKKPNITLSADDDPNLFHIQSKKTSSSSRAPLYHSNLDVEEPIPQLSMENPYERPRNHQDLVIPIVAVIFAVPMILGLMTVVARRFKDYWLTRHYRRMDFLVDGMYNDWRRLYRSKIVQDCKKSPVLLSRWWWDINFKERNVIRCGGIITHSLLLWFVLYMHKAIFLYQQHD